MLRPSRSSFQATRVSPERTYSRHSTSPLRESTAPLPTSSKIFSHPAAMLSSEKPRTRDRETVENRMRKLVEKQDATEENGVNSSSIRGAG